MTDHENVEQLLRIKDQAPVRFDEPASALIVLHKTSSGPLDSTRLDQTLHNRGVNSLVVCGLTRPSASRRRPGSWRTAASASSLPATPAPR